MLAGQVGHQHLGAIRFGWVWDAGVGMSLMESSSENWEMEGGQSWVWWVRHQHQPGLSCITLEDLFRSCLQESNWWSQAPEPVPWAAWELEHPVDFVSELKCIKHQQLLTGAMGDRRDRRMAGEGSCSTVVWPNTLLVLPGGLVGQEPRAWLQGQHWLSSLPRLLLLRHERDLLPGSLHGAAIWCKLRVTRMPTLKRIFSSLSCEMDGEFEC